ncbi:MAG: sugar phosphate isomerase/epimerase [Planctomycetia bacterium]|nr:sugar phosphate isomerase/epimerase [Planctomycetia bacterium]
MSHTLSRRDALFAAGSLAAGAAAGAVLVGQPLAAADAPAKPRLRYCLNMSTIRGQKLGLVEEVQIAAKAGYDAVEPWLNEIEQFVQSGGRLDDLRKRIADLGLAVESAIGFAPWIVDDPAARAKGLEQAKRDMDRVKNLGGTRIAAPPAGATNQPVELAVAAERYRELCKIGDEIGVTPQAEVWGFSKSLSRLSETMYVAVESGHPRACILPDIYHLHKGGSGFDSLRLVSGKAIHVFHMNDYPAEPDRAGITDAHRVFPGDGVAPTAQIVRDLVSGGFCGTLSLELFNRDYWSRDALAVAQEGLAKMKAAVEKAA